MHKRIVVSFNRKRNLSFLLNNQCQQFPIRLDDSVDMVFLNEEFLLQMNVILIKNFLSIITLINILLFKYENCKSNLNV